MWKNIGLGAAFLVVLAAPAALHAMSAPQRQPASDIPVTKAAAGSDTFVPTCSATQQVVDTRPDPAWVGASFSNDNCWAPKMPAVVNGASARRDQIVAAMASVKAYAAVSDGYQRCISDFVTARKAEADKDKKSIDASLIMIENHRITAAEDNKKKLSDRVKVAINAFNEFGSQCDD